jgi:microcin C transport system substrate-binding protein
MLLIRPMRVISAAVLALVMLMGAMTPLRAAQGEHYVGHGLALHGDLKYGPTFEHFDYVNKDAPKGGTVRLAAIGTFDNLNPFILRGVSPAGIGNVFDTLVVSSADEAFSVYGLIAETVEVPPDHSWVEFTLRAEARFHDGSPITVEDVIFSLETLKTRGHPFYRSYYANVERAERTGERKVRFSFSGEENRELPLTVGQMPVLSRAYWSGREFDRTTLEPPLGSGPYRIEALDPGRAITYKRVEDYWAQDLPVNRGRFNYDRIRYDYYRDGTVALEAFKAGQYDFRQENVARDWATGYEGPALRTGLIRKEEIRHEQPTGMQGFVFNTRRPVFQDRRVREAIIHAFDFEWTNRNLFNGAYTRTTSYFSNSELASQGLPGAEELAILERYRGRIPDEVFTREYRPPVTNGSGDVRAGLRRAFALLEEAGWIVDARGRQVHAETGEPMAFEILLVNPTFERIALPFARNLHRLGIAARVRTVDTTQYQNRLDNFEFDLTVNVFGQSLSPGNEQRDYWSSAKADVPGSQNLAGVRDPVVDELIELVISAGDRENLIHRTRALDRVLLWGHYVVPNWHVRSFRVAYWDKFGRPEVSPRYALGFETWWVDRDSEIRLAAARNRR